KADQVRAGHRQPEAMKTSPSSPMLSTLAVTASSASLASGELDHCRDLASRFGFDWRPVDTNELNDPRYLANDGDRCFWCKSALMDQLEPLAEGRTITLGVNLDDLGDHRPGQEAAAQRGARFPLVEAGFTKADVRRLARHWSVPVWDRPAMPCLSSRIPYGTEVSVPLLSRIDRAESVLRGLGFDDVRVRHYDETARIEVPAHQLTRAAELGPEIVAGLGAVGYRYVTLDLAGLQSGNLNHAVRPATSGRPAPSGQRRMLGTP
ncbi:MAG: ATP-dependent sacrificial sulfur transferase LarE, partial [Acidimicrobiia bacterium]|nr:ATP-dependent sacrificial sulfur transferase LarE [Acidimicrobiia bacterium]